MCANCRKDKWMMCIYIFVIPFRRLCVRWGVPNLPVHSTPPFTFIPPFHHSHRHTSHHHLTNTHHDLRNKHRVVSSLHSRFLSRRGWEWSERIKREGTWDWEANESIELNWIEWDGMGWWSVATLLHINRWPSGGGFSATVIRDRSIRLAAWFGLDDTPPDHGNLVASRYRLLRCSHESELRGNEDK